ncbi:hypothetical protein FKM82_024534 [Ascaphus truei]
MHVTYCCQRSIWRCGTKLSSWKERTSLQDAGISDASLCKRLLGFVKKNNVLLHIRKTFLSITGAMLVLGSTGKLCQCSINTSLVKPRTP